MALLFRIKKTPKNATLPTVKSPLVQRKSAKESNLDSDSDSDVEWKSNSAKKSPRKNKNKGQTGSSSEDEEVGIVEVSGEAPIISTRKTLKKNESEDLLNDKDDDIEPNHGFIPDQDSGISKVLEQDLNLYGKLLANDGAIKLNQSKPEVKEQASSRNSKRKNSKSSTAPASLEKQKVEHTKTSIKSPSFTSSSIIPKKEQYIKPIEQPEVGVAPETEKEKSPKVPALKIKFVPQTSENSPSPTSNLIIPKKEQYTKPIEQLEVKAQTPKEKSPKVPVLEIKFPLSPKPKESLLNILTNLTNF